MGNNDDKLRNLCPLQCPFFCNTFCVFSSIAITARCTHPFWSFWFGVYFHAISTVTVRSGTLSHFIG